MTPREKASQLIVDFQLKCKSLEYEESKQCALIAVDEILKSNPIQPLSFMLESEALDAGHEYWQEVKHTISLF